jgi:hypothetical protein
MRKLIVTLLMLCTWTGLALAQETMAKKPAMASSNAAAELRKAENDWTDGQKAGDVDKVGQLIADDWMSWGSDGKKVNKQQYLADIKSGAFKWESIENGPMDVRMFGSIGVVQGSDTEKSSYKGKDTSGKYVWMDVFQKKDGKWMAVRSQVAKVQP